MSTLSTHKGFFMSTRLQYGTASALGWFQREIQRILAGIDGVDVFYNDIRVGGHNKEERDARLKLVLQ